MWVCLLEKQLELGNKRDLNWFGVAYGKEVFVSLLVTGQRKEPVLKYKGQ